MRKLFTAISRLFSSCREGGRNASSSEIEATPDDWERKLVWIEPGTSDSPFPHRVLDCRAVALGFTSTTSDPAMADSFLQLRSDDGLSLIGSLPTNSFTVECDFRFPYNGQMDEGVLYSAGEMEDKWDFFAYGSQLYFRRSWTGVLMHVAELKYTDTEVVMTAIHSNQEIVHGDGEYAKAHIQFLVLAHLGRRNFSFPISPGTDLNNRREIALVGFNSYGSKAEFAHLL